MSKEIQTYNSDVALHKDALLSEIRNVLHAAKRNIVREVNSQIVHAYWQVGKYIVEYEQGGAQRAEYDKGLIRYLSDRLTNEFGAGFTEGNLRYMRLFYREFPNRHALSDKLTWTHYRTILKVQDEMARNFYINECISEQWSVRQLERQINTMYYERLLSGKDKDTVRLEIQQSAPKTLEPKEIIRDPYVLEFLGISQGEHLYTLPEGENQIYAAKYMTYMPSKEELKQLIAQ